MRFNPSSVRTLADLEDAVFRFYLPMARTLAHETDGSTYHSTAAEEAAELGLAQAVLAWRNRDHDGFRRFASSTIRLQLNNRTSSHHSDDMR